MGGVDSAMLRMTFPFYSRRMPQSWHTKTLLKRFRGCSAGKEGVLLVTVIGEEKTPTIECLLFFGTPTGAEGFID